MTLDRLNAKVAVHKTNITFQIKNKDVDQNNFSRYFSIFLFCFYFIGLVSINASEWFSYRTSYAGNEFGSRSPNGQVDYRGDSRSGYDSVSVSTRRFSDNGNSGVLSQRSNSGPRFDSGEPIPSRISKYITFKEATYSSYAQRYGIKNIPSESQFAVMSFLGISIFDKIRDHYNTPLYITSFFRSKELNKRLGGAFYSDHMVLDNSAAVDIDMDGKRGPSNNELFYHILKNENYYKLIAEFPSKGKLSWVHISYSTDVKKNKEKNTYVAVKVKNRTFYLPYLSNAYLVQ